MGYVPQAISLICTETEVPLWLIHQRLDEPEKFGATF